MSEKGVDLKPPSRISRRGLLRGAIAVGGVALAAKFGVGFDAATRNETEYQPEKHAIPPSVSEKKEKKVLLNEILNLAPKSKDRIVLEEEYVNNAQNLEEIDRGFLVIQALKLRKKLLDKRENLRTQGKDGLVPLSEAEKNWAEENEIYPEALAICKEAYTKALGFMKRMQANGVFINTKPPEQMLISPGGMASLSRAENLCFTLLGERIAADFFKNNKKELDALSFISQELKKLTGFEYSASKIPGSDTGDIGFQMRPSSALEVLEDFKKIGESVNFFDLISSTTAAYIFLASKGYDANNSTLIKKALTGWNQKLGEKGEIARLDASYRKRFS